MLFRIAIRGLVQAPPAVIFLRLIHWSLIHCWSFTAGLILLSSIKEHPIFDPALELQHLSPQLRASSTHVLAIPSQWLQQTTTP